MELDSALAYFIAFGCSDGNRPLRAGMATELSTE